jgi:hypothetical protein
MLGGMSSEARDEAKVGAEEGATDGVAAAGPSEDSGNGLGAASWPLAPMLAWLNLVQEFGTTALGSVGQVTQLTQAQWEALRGGMSLMSQLPLGALQESDRELKRLRDAVRAAQLQMEIFDQQLAALDQLLRPLHDWANAWRGLIEPGQD